MIRFLRRGGEGGGEELHVVSLLIVYFSFLDRLYIFHLQVLEFCVKLSKALDPLVWMLQ